MLSLSWVLGIISAGALGYICDVERVIQYIFRNCMSALRRLFHRTANADEKSPSSNDIAQMLDLLVLSLSAGLSFDYSVAMYCSQYDNRLSRDLSEALFSWQIGFYTRVEALEQLAQTYNNRAFDRFVQCVVESIELGSPVAQALERQADMIRQSRKHELEARIEKLPIRILIPLTTLILPAMLIAILGPIFSGMFK